MEEGHGGFGESLGTFFFDGRSRGRRTIIKGNRPLT